MSEIMIITELRKKITRESTVQELLDFLNESEVYHCDDTPSITIFPDLSGHISYLDEEESFEQGELAIVIESKDLDTGAE